MRNKCTTDAATTWLEVYKSTFINNLMNAIKIYTHNFMLTLGIFPNMFVPFWLYRKKKMAETEIWVNLLFMTINREFEERDL